LHRHIRITITLFLATCAVVLNVHPGQCWGNNGHPIITQAAIDLLPSGLRSFYCANSKYVVFFSTLPDDWKQTHRNQERANHYVNLDLLSEPPFADLVRSRSAAEKRFGKKLFRQAGFLPWVIQDHYRKLIKAFRDKDIVEIDVQSAILAHYVADAHVPLHATRHYDGKTADQQGIHGRWEVELIDRYPQRVDPDAPAMVGDILKAAFGWCIASYKCVDAVLAADDEARAVDPSHSDVYYDVLHRRAGHILRGRLKSAASALAGVYVAAWTEAGKPALPAKPAPFFWGH